MKGFTHRSSLAEPLENRVLLATDFSLVAIPDTQYLVEVPGATVMNDQTDWVKDNATAANIKFVAQQGDLLRRGYSDYQAGQASAAFAKLDGVVPYTLDIGNHDYDNQFDDLDHHISSANFTSWFGDARYQGISNRGFGGSSLDQRNRYQIFSSDSQQYMVLSLEWEAPDSAIAWAQGVIDSHRQIPVILTTHEYLDSGGRTDSPLDPAGNAGQGIFDKLVYPNQQIFLVLSGHTGATRYQTSTNLAHTTVIETVGDDGGVGRFQLFEFSPGTSKITITTYAPDSTLGDTSLGQTEYNVNFATRFSFTTGTIANDDTLATPQGAAVIGNVLTNDLTANAAIASSTSPANGTVTLNPDGSFTYTPNSGYHGNDSFTYTLSGGNTAKVTIQVNTAPTADADSAGTTEGRAVTVNVLANDADPDAGDLFRPILTSLPAHGAVFAESDGTFTYTPDPKYTGPDSFTYVTSDGNAVSAATSVGMTVNPAPAYTIAYNYPVAETTVAGTATGSYANLRATDGSLETIAENGSRVLDHRWQFSVTAGAEITACINAWRASGADEYRLTYSTDGSSWHDMIQIVPASSLSVTRIGTPITGGTGADPGEPYQMWQLPAGTQGIVWIRVVQASKSYTEPSALAVDDLFILSTGVPTTSRLALISDYGTLEQSEADVMNLVKGWDAQGPLDAIVTSGDNDQNVGNDYVNRVGDYYGEFIYGRGSTTQRFLPAPGNHDWGNTVPGSLANYLSFFTLPSNERYYSYRMGAVEVFVIDSDVNEPDGTDSLSIQAQWLHDALASSTAPWQIVTFHHAAYSSATGHGDTFYMQWPLQAWGADLVVSGHDHVYERINPSGLSDGLRYIVNGVGGWNSLGSFGTPVPGSEMRYNAENGAILLEATGTTLSYQFINTAGQVIDTYSSSNVPLPHITVAATDASEVGQVGGFTFTRSNVMTGDVTVRFTVAGTASSGDDYEPIPTSVVIPDGVSSLTVPLTAIDDALPEGDETVVVTIDDDPAYVRATTVATAIIVDDDLQTAMFQQGVNTYAGTIDTQLEQYAPDTGYGSSVSLNVDADEPPGSGNDVQVLMRFDDIFGLATGQIPPGATILGAALQLQVSNAGSSVELHRMLTSWSDADTWNSMVGGIQVDDAEAAFTADPITAAVPLGLLSIDVTASLAAWAADPLSNLGWAILTTGTDGVDFNASEGTTPPKLVVQFADLQPNTPPVASDDAYNMSEDGTLATTAPGVLANDTDADADSLVASIVTALANGALTLNADGSFTYTPDANHNGTDSFTYRAFDGRVYSNVATVTVTIAPVNDSPVAVPDSLGVVEDGSLTISASDLLGNDTDPEGDSLSIASITLPANGTLADNGDGTFTYTPDADFNGTDAFTYRVSDGSLQSNDTTVTIAITPVNDAPSFIAGADVSVDEDSGAYSATWATGIDDGDPEIVQTLTFNVSNDTTSLFLQQPVLTADGTLTFAPAANANGTAIVSVYLTDGSESTGLQTFQIAIAPVNDAPTVDHPVADVKGQENSADTVVDLSSVFADIDDVTLTYGVFSSNPSLVSASITGTDLTLSYTANNTGTAAITVTATDGSGASVSDIFTVNVSAGPLDQFAGTAGTTTIGTSTGSAADIEASDDAYQVLTEKLVSINRRKQTSQLEHFWTIDVLSGSTVTFFVEAYHSASSDGDDFVFAYSTDGTTFTDMITVTKTADDDQAQSYILPGETNGSVTIRVRDTSTAPDATSLDSLFIDQMFIRTASPQLPQPTLGIVATDAQAAETDQDPAVFSISRTGDTSQAVIVPISLTGTADAGDYTLSGVSGSPGSYYVTLAAGAASTTFSVVPIDDGLVEETEDVLVTIQPVADYLLGPATATAAIADNDGTTVIPLAPTNLTGQASNGGIVDLTWTDNATNETGYVLEWSSDGSNWQEWLGADSIAPLPADTTSFRVEGLSRSTFYYFRVKAVCFDESSDYSNVLKIRSSNK